MTPRGNYIKIKPKPRDTVTKGGILIPDTATPPTQEWGEITDGNGLIPNGSRVLYMAKNIEKDGEKIVNKKKVLYYENSRADS